MTITQLVYRLTTIFSWGSLSSLNIWRAEVYSSDFSCYLPIRSSVNSLGILTVILYSCRCLILEYISLRYGREERYDTTNSGPWGFLRFFALKWCCLWYSLVSSSSSWSDSMPYYSFWLVLSVFCSCGRSSPRCLCLTLRLISSLIRSKGVLGLNFGIAYGTIDYGYCCLRESNRLLTLPILLGYPFCLILKLL